MNDLITESVIRLAEKLQLPERIVNIEQLPWVPFNSSATCFFKPLRFDLSTGTWTYLFRVGSNQALGRHRHTGGAVIGYTLQGRWRYEERDWTAVPGTFIFEPPGDIHTFISEDEEVVALFIISGTLQYFDGNNQFSGQDDIYTVIQKYQDYCTHNQIPIHDNLIY